MATLNQASLDIWPSTNGPRYFTIGEATTDFSSASTARSRAMPAFSASRTASLKASICTARPRFVATFIVFASPSSPTWVIAVPIASRNGRTRSSAPASPPTMNEAWPCSTVIVLPETGTSSSAAPRAATGAASSRTTAGDTVLMSTSTALAARPAITPSAPSATARSAASSVTIVKTASAPSAAARGDFASVSPAPTSSRALSGVRFQPLT